VEEVAGMVQPTAVRTGGGVGVLDPEEVWNQPTVPMRRRVRQAPVSNQWLAEAEFTDLVDAALDGDRRAVEHLLGRIQPLIVRYCRARVGGRERTLVSAEDIAQEVCVAAPSATAPRSCRSCPTARRSRTARSSTRSTAR
jgi:RNA polymerase sigma-70 factor (ECF subfamily)